MTEDKNRRPALLIMAKAPIPGFCKTRMQPVFTPEQCAKLQDAFFKDLMALKEELEPDIHVWVAFTPEKDEAYFRAFSSRLFGQKGSDLGERMHNSLESLFDQSYHPLVVIGTDTPLDKKDIFKAFDQLKKHPVVIGPAHDGGYYLLGLKKPLPELFSDMSWGTSKVFDETKRRAEKLGIRVGILEKRRDIDNPEDLLIYQNMKTNPHLDQWKAENLEGEKSPYDRSI